MSGLFPGFNFLHVRISRFVRHKPGWGYWTLLESLYGR